MNTIRTDNQVTGILSPIFTQDHPGLRILYVSM